MLALKKWSFKAGFRYERTVLNAEFQNGDVSQSYGNLLPSLSIQNTIEKFGSLTLAYSKRIERPNIYQLNPFNNQANPNFVLTGNPKLRPSTGHSLNLSYSKTGRLNLNIDFGYDFSSDKIQRISYLLNDTVTYTTLENIGKDNSANSNFNVIYNITKRLSLNLNAGISYRWLEGMHNNQELTNKGFQYSGNANLGYRPIDGFSLNLNVTGWSPVLQLQGEGSRYMATSLSASKGILKNKGSISLSITNPYQKYIRFISYTTTPEFEQTNLTNYYVRRFSISFNYRFGGLKGYIKRNKNRIEKNDVSKEKNSKGPLGN